MKWGKSTYTSQIHFPADATLHTIFDKRERPRGRTTGPYFASLTFDDGSKLQVVGASPSDASSYLDYMVTLSRPDHIPINWKERVVSGKRASSGDIKTLYCRKAEYYSRGGVNNMKADKSIYFPK